jgi:hypothetical protein
MEGDEEYAKVCWSMLEYAEVWKEVRSMLEYAGVCSGLIENPSAAAYKVLKSSHVNHRFFTPYSPPHPNRSKFLKMDNLK